MKKLFVGTTAVIIAVAAFAFTKPAAESKAESLYWFLTDPNGNVQTTSSIPPFQATDPHGCSGTAQFCSKAYTGYTMISPGVYGPSGTLQVIHKKS